MNVCNIKAMQTGVQNYDGVRIGPPPDLPSLLLHNRIVYLGMPLVPAVTELIVAEFLYLQYENSEKPVFTYLNSTGTSNPDGSSAGFETEAFAITDTMNYIKPPVHTICVGQAFGTCAMLLSSGEPGNRSALPNATIMIHQPKSQARGQASDIAIKAKEVLYNRKQCFEIIATTSGQSIQKIMKDASRTKYLTPQEAVEYGIIDKILETPKKNGKSTSDFLNLL
jgi:ATP-dependent Clp protease protease subunit